MQQPTATVAPAVTEGRGAEAEAATPRPPNQGAAPARRAPQEIVADQDRARKRGHRRIIEGTPELGQPYGGKVLVGWWRADTSRSGQRSGLAGTYTDLGVDFEDGTTEYLTALTKAPL